MVAGPSQHSGTREELPRRRLAKAARLIRVRLFSWGQLVDRALVNCGIKAAIRAKNQ